MLVRGRPKQAINTDTVGECQILTYVNEDLRARSENGK
jgi:hypothetical protein